MNSVALDIIAFGLLAALILLITIGMMSREQQGKGIGAFFSYFMIVMTAVLCTALLAVAGALTTEAAIILSGATGITVYRYWNVG